MYLDFEFAHFSAFFMYCALSLAGDIARTERIEDKNVDPMSRPDGLDGTFVEICCTCIV